MAIAGWDEEEVVRLLSIYLEDDGFTLGEMYGAEAVTAVEAMRDLIMSRLNTDEQNLSLWSDFEDDPENNGVELVGWLEAFVEADPGFATVGGHTQYTGSNLGFEVSGRDQREKLEAIEDPDMLQVVEGEGMPGLFQQLYDAVDEHPTLSQVNKDVITEILREMEAQVARGRKANEELLISNVRPIRRIAPDIVDIMLPGMEGFAEEVRGPLYKVLKKIEKAEAEEECEF
jgi:hypothetical protein